MFKEIYDMLKAGEHLGVSLEIEYLKGLCAKSNNLKETLNKIKRNKALIKNGR